MKRLRMITRPKRAAITADVVLAFVIDIIEAVIPLVQNKNPQNPVVIPDDDDSTS
ncbi:MAG TPA: hypothetical protein P5069_02395 [Candidatus Hydrogenedentes bacterium]|nr:hypothetical protein [Candidatus Hydrogenedentota bacterium]HQL93084.1 hypothetical protein [Candidatus Hydrogenedentota bacterium]HRZ81275.1 hypothetical protein [Candidatus Hydrogenedentota bacterium]